MQITSHRYTASRLTWMLVILLSLWAAVTSWAWYAQRNLGSAAHITGYALFAVVLVLMAFKARKRSLVLPLGTVHDWKQLHLILGALSLPLYFQHTGVMWPQGVYEQCMALVFYGVSLSAILGLCLQKIYPKRLSQMESEIIFERIPMELAAIKTQVNALILQTAKSHPNSVLADFYVETLAWYFHQPRFVWAHLMGSQRSTNWVHQHVTVLKHYLSEPEQAALAQLEDWALRKGRLDAHHAMQGALKLWLFVHVPLALALLLLGCWHLLLINLYTR